MILNKIRRGHGLRIAVVIMMALVLLPFSVIQAQAQTSYIIVHADNPEGVEISSIQGMSQNSIEIYDGDALIGYGAYSAETHNRPMAISNGSHTIKAKFNGIELKQNVDLSPSETKALTFTFDRTESDLWDKIPVSDQTSVAISGSWVGKTSLIEDIKQNNLGWNLRVHFMEPYDGGYDEEGNYIPSSGSYNAIATTKWIKEINKLEYELFTNYDISITPVPGRQPSTPHWSSLVDGLTSYSKFPLELYNSHFSEWFIQYSNYCTDLSLQIGDLELLDYQSNYLIKSVPAVNTQMQINSAKIETWGEAWHPITQTGGGELNIKMSSVPYDLTGSGVKENQPDLPPVASFENFNVLELGNINEKTLVGGHMVGGVIRFDPSESFDPDGKIINYEWNFDNGIKFITNEPNVYDITFREARIYNVALTVTDNDGSTNTYKETLDLTLKDGDLIFIRTAWWDIPFTIVGNRYTHVGMYAGGQWMIETILSSNSRSNGRSGVTLTPLDGWSYGSETYGSETYATLVRVESADDKIRQEAVAFALSKIGQDYDLNVWKKGVNSPNYYCSELIWAAYYKASKGKIDLGNTGKKGGVWPDDIIYNDPVNIKVIGYHWEHDPK